MAKEFTAKAVITAEDRASAEIRKAKQELAGLGDVARESAIKTESSKNIFERFTHFIATRFVITLGEAARLIRGAFEGIKEAANLEGQRRALEINLAQQGVAFDKFIEKLNEVARGTVSTADLIRASSQALLLGIPADKISALLEVARASAIATGQSVSDAFNDIATGIGRTSPLILDNLGITIKLSDAYREMAEQTGQSVESLSEVERKTAVLNKVLEVGSQRVKLFAEAHSQTKEAIEQAGAALDDFKNIVSRLATGVFAQVALILNAIGGAAVLAAQGLVKLRLSWNEFTGDLEEAASLRKTDASLGSLVDRMDQLGRRLAKTRNDIFSFGESAETTTIKVRDTTATVKDAVETVEEFSDSVEEGAVTIREYAKTTDTLRESMVRLSAQIRFTSTQFDELVRQAGRAAAIQKALQEGAFLSQAGRVINLPGGGSRLVSEPGAFTRNAGQFNSDGSVRRF